MSRRTLNQISGTELAPSSFAPVAQVGAVACPFCRADTELVAVRARTSGLWSVRCCCSARGPEAGSAQGATSAWNKWPWIQEGRCAP